MIHETTFRRELHGLLEAAETPLPLYAMLAAALRLLNLSEGRLPADRIAQEFEQLRNTVITRASNSLTVESLQALIIIAFTHVSTKSAA